MLVMQNTSLAERGQGRGEEREEDGRREEE
jgi:hypothetical protein